MSHFKGGTLRGTTHTSVGQEIVAVLAMEFVKNGDYIFSNHRGHGHYIAYGGDPLKLLLEIRGHHEGIPVYKDIQLDDLFDNGFKKIHICLPKKKEKKVGKKFIQKGFEFISIYHPSSCISNNATIGGNVFIGPNCNIGPFTSIRNFTRLQNGSSVAHHSIIGESVQLTDGSIIAGHVKIGENTLIGLGVTVNNHIIIGENVIVLSGVSIYKNILNNSIVRK